MGWFRHASTSRRQFAGALLMRLRLRHLNAVVFMLVASVAMVGRLPSSQPGSLDTEVYAVLLDSLGAKPLPDTLLLGDSTLRFESLGVGTTSRWLDSIPAELPRRLVALSKTRRSSETLVMPRPAHVLTHAELAEIFSAGPTGWTEFYRRYPKQRGYFQFAPVAFTADSLDAFVYYEFRCGGRCGHGEAVWLTRRGTSRHWRVRRVIPLWSA